MVQFLAERCNFIEVSGYCHGILSVCHLSVTRVYCDKTTEVKITQFSHKSSVRSLTFSMVSRDRLKFVFIFVFERNCTLRFRFLFRENHRRKSENHQLSQRPYIDSKRVDVQSQSSTVSLIIHNDVRPGLDIFIASSRSTLLLRHMQAACSYVHRGHSTPH